MYNGHGSSLAERASRTALGCLAASLAVLLASSASAQVDEGFNAQNFQVPIDPFGYVTLNGARVLDPGQVFIAGYVDYAEDPLDLRDIREGVIESMTFVHGVMSIGLLEFGDHGGGVEIGAVVPYALQMDGFGRDPGAGSFETTTPPAVELPDGRLADIRGEVKVVLLDREEPIGIALRGWGTVPTGEDKYFLSNDERFGAGGGVILEKEFSWVRFGAEADYEWIEGDTVISTRTFMEEGDPEPKLLVIDDKLHLRAGLGLKLFFDDLWLIGEAHHYTRANNLWNTRRESPIEIGGALRLEKRIMLVLGASTGLANENAVGAPEYRLYGGLGVTFF